MEKFLRDWRQDALNKHQYDSAIFIGDKLLALTRTLFSIHAISIC
jgi:anaphase-promoting complex subunit 6